MFTTIALLFGALSFATADDAPPATIPDVIRAIQALVKERADVEKREADLRLTLDRLLKEQQAEVDKLNPKPPVPPAPPKPPEPADPLRAKLAAAFAADPAPLDQRKGHAKDLAALYRQAAKLALDPAVPSSGELLAQVARAAATMLNDPPAPAARHLADVRKAVAGELAALLPTDDALADAQRRAAAELFVRLAGILEELGK